MSFKDKAVSMANLAPREKETRTPTQSKAAPVELLRATKERDRADLAEARVAELEQQQGRALELPLDALLIVEGRRRKLTDEEYAHLKANLEQHPLVHPVVVRPAGHGKFEVVSGHNRVAIYRELGRERIRAVVADAGDQEADEFAFYANLMQTNLSDYEKYLGLRLITGPQGNSLTQEELAKRTGLSRQTVQQLLAFEKLPDQALAPLKANPTVLGSKAAAKLAALKDRGARVADAIHKLAKGEMTQEEAVRWASAAESAPKAAKPEPITVRSGKQVFCKITPVARVLRLEFKTEEERARAETAVREALERLAKE